MKTVKSFCRICNAHCGMVLTVDDDGHIAYIRGDKDQPMSKGYVCFKGLQAEEAHHGPARLLKPLKRQPDGSFAPMASEQALDEIAERIAGIVANNGAEAVALFNGNGGTPNSSGYPMTHAFLAALGSPSLYSSLTIDQSAKVVAFERLGGWAAGLQDIGQSDVLLFIGTNPLLSHSTVPVMGPDPTRRLKAAKTRGMKLIVVDPRRTETAHHADLFLQPVPGEDAAILSGILRVILDENWDDAAFCETHVGSERMAALRTSLKPFSPAMVEARAGLEPGQIRAAAAMFARDNRSGAAYAATGPCMAPYSNLTQHLVEVLNVVCGRFRRPGQQLIVDLTAPEVEIRAEVIAPPRSWSAIPSSRIRGIGQLGGERLTGTLAEEILTPGGGRVRALLVNGGNPAASVPDQRRMVEALRDLELLVAIEPYMTVTAALAHYILPPRMQYERADLPLLIPNFPLQPENWLQFTSAVLSPPLQSDLVEDWYVYWSLAKRLGFTITYAGTELDMGNSPTTEELLKLRLKGARVSFDDLKRYPSGAVFRNDAWRVRPPRSEMGARFDVMPSDVAGELAAFHAAPALHSDAFPYLLSSRRNRDTFNSNGIQLAKVRARNPSNPLCVHPDDLVALHISPGDRIKITSEHGSIVATTKADPSMKRGVVSMTHCWGGLPDDDARDGDNVNLLIDSTSCVEAINAMPRMSAIPVGLSHVSTAQLTPTSNRFSSQL
jgi:anaerobic selenocysteine-containing dehydrogenase